MDWEETTARQDEKQLCVGIWCDLFQRFDDTYCNLVNFSSNTVPGHSVNHCFVISMRSNSCFVKSHKFWKLSFWSPKIFFYLPTYFEYCDGNPGDRICCPYSLTNKVVTSTKAYNIYTAHYCDAIMGTIASEITSLTIVYTTVYSDADQSKHQSSASLAFVWGIHRDRWLPRTKGQLRGKSVHLMTSSWSYTEEVITDKMKDSV